MRILMWVHLAERPLSVDELLHALATRVGDRDLDRNNFPSRHTFLNCCLGLVLVDDETSTVRLVHYSLHEYLFNSQDPIFQNGHESITQTCLTYIMFESAAFEQIYAKFVDFCNHKVDSGFLFSFQFRALRARLPTWLRSSALDSINDKSGLLKPSKFRENLLSLLSQFALLRYAICEWGNHARKACPMEDDTICLTQRYFMNPQKLDASAYIRLYHKRYVPNDVIWLPIRGFSPLHITAYFGIYQMLPSKRSSFVSSKGFAWPDAASLGYTQWAREGSDITDRQWGPCELERLAGNDTAFQCREAWPQGSCETAH